jgi:hypothetical protein
LIKHNSYGTLTVRGKTNEDGSRGTWSFDCTQKLGLIKDEISEREAFRIYGPAKVRSWNNEKLIRAIKIGSGNSKKKY